MSFGRQQYVSRLAESGCDLRAAQRLRRIAFGIGDVDGGDGLDADAFDAKCRHVLIEETATGELVGCFRYLAIPDPQAVTESYSGQFYELSALQAYGGRLAEMGRFCLRPGHRNPDILRIAFAELARLVDEDGIDLLIGCSSFQGTDARRYADAFAVLRAAHLAPRHFLPRVKAPRVFRFAQRIRRKPDLRRAMAVMPPLLRSYLSLGGWVSDHAVIDEKMNTLHVFTGLEIASMPPARKRVLRAAAGVGRGGPIDLAAAPG